MFCALSRIFPNIQSEASCSHIRKAARRKNLNPAVPVGIKRPIILVCWVCLAVPRLAIGIRKNLKPFFRSDRHQMFVNPYRTCPPVLPVPEIEHRRIPHGYSVCGAACLFSRRHRITPQPGNSESDYHKATFTHASNVSGSVGVVNKIVLFCTQRSMLAKRSDIIVL